MIVDYCMPDITGIELCQQLKNTPTKKILLTGHADFKQAVHAFNAGIIHYFICKDDPNLDTILLDNIKKLSQDYFRERTQALLHHIEADTKLPHSDPIFIKFINKFFQENNIREYYLSDKNGGMLLINNHGQKFYLVTHTDKTLDYFVELHSQENEVIFFVNGVKNRKLIPFFGVGKEMWGMEASNWSSYFYTPQILEGRETYYWALVSL